MHPRRHRHRSDGMPEMRDVARRPRALSPSASRPAITGRDHLDGDGLEWEDLMPEINRQTDPSNMLWCLTDLETGAENHHIFWTFTVGDRIKIRLVNELESDHPMHHPFHIHGAGRFLILRATASRRQPRLEGHGAGAGRTDRRHPPRRDQPRPLDGALPHRRAHRERNDVQLRRRAYPHRPMNAARQAGTSQHSGIARRPSRLVIGAGQAGLAVGHALRAAGVRY